MRKLVTQLCFVWLRVIFAVLHIPSSLEVGRGGGGTGGGPADHTESVIQSPWDLVLFSEKSRL